MAVKYKVVAKGQPGVKGGDKKQYYAANVNQDVQGIDKVTAVVENVSTVSGADIRAVLYAAVQAINGFLADGDIVRLGDLGSFRLSLSSTGEAYLGAVTANNITGARIIFTPGAMLKTLLANLKYEKKSHSACCLPYSCIMAALPQCVYYAANYISYDSKWRNAHLMAAFGTSGFLFE